MTQIPTEIKNYTAEQLEAIAKRMRAQKELELLEQNGVSEFQTSASSVTSVEDAYKLCSNFKWRVEKIRRVLHPSEKGAKRGRKSKQ